MSTKQDQRIQTLNRALALIEQLSENEQLGVTELSARLGINKTMTFRILATLEESGYVRQDGETDQYKLTLRLFNVGSRVVTRINALREARPVLESLARETGETVHLAVREGTTVVYVDKIDSKHTLRLFSRVGSRAPAWCTGLGKALLSILPSDKIDSLFSNRELTRFTSNTITNIESLKDELRLIAETGIAVDNQEHELGIHCVAAPIMATTKHAAAAISVSWPETRHSEERMEHFRGLIVRGAKDASRRIGWDYSDSAGSDLDPFRTIGTQHSIHSKGQE